MVAQAIADGVPRQLQREHAQPVIACMNALGRLGRKSGGGFHDFPAGGAKRLWPGLAAEFPPAAVQPEVAALTERLLLAQALEAARCLEEGIVSAPRDADVAAVLGIGFPAWTGGPLGHVDTLGIGAFVAACQRLADGGAARFRPSAWLLERAAEGRKFYPDTAEVAAPAVAPAPELVTVA